MILADFECRRCHHVHETLCERDQAGAKCPKCGGKAKRIITLAGVYLGNQDAKWVRESAAALIDREVALKSRDPLERKLATNPDRSSVREYMNRKGLRHFENEKGAPPVWHKPQDPDVRKLGDEAYKRHQDRKAIEVRS